MLAPTLITADELKGAARRLAGEISAAYEDGVVLVAVLKGSIPFLADMILAADKLNPQIVPRLVTPFGRWRRFEAKRSALMREALERIAATPGLSKDVFEQVSKSLA